MSLRNIFKKILSTEKSEADQFIEEDERKAFVAIPHIPTTGHALDRVFNCLRLLDLNVAQARCLMIEESQHARNIAMALDELAKTHLRVTREGLRGPILHNHLKALIDHADDLPLIIEALKLLNDEDVWSGPTAHWWATPENLMAVISVIDQLKPLDTTAASVRNVVAILLKLHDEQLMTDHNRDAISMYPQFSQIILDRLKDRAAPHPLTQAYLDQVLNGISIEVKRTVAEAIASLSPIPGACRNDALEMLIPKFCERFLFTTAAQRLADEKEAKALAATEVDLQAEKEEAIRNRKVC